MTNNPRSTREDCNFDALSRSPHHKHKNNSRRRSLEVHDSAGHVHYKRRKLAVPKPEDLPFRSRNLTKKDYGDYKNMFSLYLEIQKGKILEDLDAVEAKGRWKSFIGKWNRGELSEGWYDPSTLHKANVAAFGTLSRPSEGKSKLASSKTQESGSPVNHAVESTSDSDDSIGPILPEQEIRPKSYKYGPRIPKLEDLQIKREMEAADAVERRDETRLARQIQRQEQKASLDELLPRAAAGTRERQIEKKKETNEKMKSFREKSPGAPEISESQLMGDGDGIDSFKKTKQEYERKKNERELRKEENLRARMAEREERLQEYRIKEEGTMAMLKALAKQRFG